MTPRKHRPDHRGLILRALLIFLMGAAALACSEDKPKSEAPIDWPHTGEITTGDAAVVNAPFFTEVTDSVEGFNDLNKDHGRAMVVDVDGDGLDDIVTLSLDKNPMDARVYRNLGASEEGTPRFEDFTEASGLDAVRAAIMVFGDIDNDGDQDLFTGLSFRTDRLGNVGTLGVWLNNGEGVFEFKGPSGVESALDGQDGTARIFKEMAAATLADFDGDGALDLYIGNWRSASPDIEGGGGYAPAADELYKGDGAGQFTLMTLPDQHNPLTSLEHPDLAGVPRSAYGVAVGDYDSDGDLDIFVNNYGAGRPALESEPIYWDHNLLWRNDGGMQFTDVSVTAGVAATTRGIGGIEEESPVVINTRTYTGPIGGNGFGCEWADFDNDADLDLIIGTIAHPDYSQSDRTMLHVNPGGAEPVFSEESAARGLEYYEDELHPAFVDVNNDGLLDLAMSRLRGGSKWEFYFQASDNNFYRRLQRDTGVDIERPGPSLWLDVDGDGDLDFYMPKNTENTGGRLFVNNLGQDNGVLVVHLSATAPRDATGARVSLVTSTGTQVRELTSGVGHYNTQKSRALHFGLGGDSGGTLSVRWPDGTTEDLGDVRADVAIRVTQGEGVELLTVFEKDSAP